MTDDSVRISFKINFPVILITVLLLHAFFLMWNALPRYERLVQDKSPRTPLKIRDIRTVGSRESKKDAVYLSKNETKSQKIEKETPTKAPSKSNLSLADLNIGKQAIARPGSRPEIPQEKSKAINAISLKGPEIKRFVHGQSAASLSGDPRTASLSNSDVMVNLEVPEGVNPDELNKYELMFYSFQRRTAINYINSFFKNLDKFQRENPHLRFPMTESKQVMTGRLTYDEKGNIKQIKMIRWSNVDKLQDFFVDVLKDMDTLHNPPQALWEKTGEFSIFFSLVING